MDVNDYREKIGVDVDSVESILMYCAFLRNVYRLPHRTLHQFDWFVGAMIWGGSRDEDAEIHKKYHHLYTVESSPYGDVREKRPLLIYAQAFMEYCESEYLLDAGRHGSDV